MSSMIPTLPLPVTDDPTDAGFWRAALRSELTVQQCESCARYRFPPRPMCPYCHCMGTRWVAMSGRGRVWSFAAPQPPLLPAFAALIPYVTLVVELEEDSRLRIVGPLVNGETGGIQGVAPSAVRIGDPVRVRFIRYADDVAMPCWSLTS